MHLKISGVTNFKINYNYFSKITQLFLDKTV